MSGTPIGTPTSPNATQITANGVLNGVADDSVIFNAAYTTAISSSGNASIWVPRGGWNAPSLSTGTTKPVLWKLDGNDFGTGTVPVTFIGDGDVCQTFDGRVSFRKQLLSSTNSYAVVEVTLNNANPAPGAGVASSLVVIGTSAANAGAGVYTWPLNTQLYSNTTGGVNQDVATASSVFKTGNGFTWQYFGQTIDSSGLVQGSIIANEYDIQANGPESATTGYSPGFGSRTFIELDMSPPYEPSAWQASHAYAVGAAIQPTSPNGFTYVCTVAGTSGSSQPTWPVSTGTVTDGGVTWKFGTTINFQVSRAIGIGGTSSAQLGAGILAGAYFYDAILELSGSTLVDGGVKDAAIRLHADHPIDFSGDLTDAHQNLRTLRYDSVISALLYQGPISQCSFQMNDNGPFVVTNNLNGTLPVGNLGIALGANFSGSAGESDFINPYTLASTSFEWLQQTGSSTATSLMSLLPSGQLNLTGPLLLPGPPTSANQAATKAYVDAGGGGGGGPFLPLNGSLPMTGELTVSLSNNPAIQVANFFRYGYQATTPAVSIQSAGSSSNNTAYQALIVDAQYTHDDGPSGAQGAIYASIQVEGKSSTDLYAIHALNYISNLKSDLGIGGQSQHGGIATQTVKQLPSGGIPSGKSLPDIFTHWWQNVNTANVGSASGGADVLLEADVVGNGPDDVWKLSTFGRTGNSTAASPIITGVTNTSPFSVGQQVALSQNGNTYILARVASIVTNTSVTIDTNAVNTITGAILAPWAGTRFSFQNVLNPSVVTGSGGLPLEWGYGHYQNSVEDSTGVCFFGVGFAYYAGYTVAASDYTFAHFDAGPYSADGISRGVAIKLAPGQKLAFNGDGYRGTWLTGTSAGGLQLVKDTGVIASIDQTGLVNASRVQVTAATQVSGADWATQGAILGWNRTGGGGEADFYSSKGTGGGGFNFYNVATSISATPALIASFDGSGNLTAPSVTLAGPPTTALQAATKAYVDASAGGSSPLLSVTSFSGIDPTGVADSTAGINAMFSTVPSGVSLYWPAGTYKISSVITVPSKTMTWQGAGRLATTIYINNSNCAAFIFNSAVNIADIGFTGTTTLPTSGTMLTYNSGTIRSRLERFWMVNFYSGININGPSDINLLHGQMFTWHALGTAVVYTGGEACLIDDLVIQQTTAPGNGNGIVVYNGGITINNSQLLACGNAMYLGPGSGQAVNSMWVQNTGFDSSVNGLVVAPTGSGGVERCWFIGCWFGGCSQYGIEISSPGGAGQVNGMDFVNCHILGNAASGVIMPDANSLNLNFTGCKIAGNSYGINFFAGGNQFTIKDCVIGPYGGFAANGQAGINLGGFSSYYQIVGNIIINQINTIIGTGVQGGAAPGIAEIISDNQGYVDHNKGQATINAGNVSVVVNHGMNGIPRLQDILLTGLTGMGNPPQAIPFVLNPNGSNFTIEIGISLGFATGFTWHSSLACST